VRPRVRYGIVVHLPQAAFGFHAFYSLNHRFWSRVSGVALLALFCASMADAAPALARGAAGPALRSADADVPEAAQAPEIVRRATRDRSDSRGVSRI